MTKVTLQGAPFELEGTFPSVGTKVSSFVVVDNDLKEVKLEDFGSEILVLVSVPSLDTPVCDLEARRFNAEASKLSSKVEIAIVSMDLPFAQKRWCGQLEGQKVHTYSDYRYASFGKALGVLIADLRLLARAIFVLDGQRNLVYSQLVPEVAQEPDYEEVLEVISKLT
ncbi:MAG: thioredoxin-dependent peroxiredoxin [Desulfonauticus sp.]|nr:thioredoxin-dependent peroxiredoxin [Desulfonauticus sp.]